VNCTPDNLRRPHPAGRRAPARRGFTLVELLVGMSLALIVMTAVLSSFLFLGRNFTRLANQQTLENQGRRTLLTFEQDVRLASAITSASSSQLTLTIPPVSGSTATSITYAYDSATDRLVRTAGGTSRTLLENIVDTTFGVNPFTYGFKYHDSMGTQIAASTTASLTAGELLSVKQVSLSFLTATGVAANGTKTPNYYGTSARLALRNKPLLQ